MKFSTAKEHRDFFHKHGWIEFEGMISKEQLILANQAVDEVLSDRLHIAPDQIESVSSEEIFLHGRDLWRSNAYLRKLSSQLRFAEIMTELTEKKTLRLGYDQLLMADPESRFSKIDPRHGLPFFEKTTSLEEISCLSDILCGLLIALNEVKERDSDLKKEQPDIFSYEPGNVVFIRPSLPISWFNLSEHALQRFYLIVFTAASSHYVLQPNDPHTHDLKKIGYVFNDKLSDKLNPIIFR